MHAKVVKVVKTATELMRIMRMLVSLSTDSRSYAYPHRCGVGWRVVAITGSALALIFILFASSEQAGLVPLPDSCPCQFIRKGLQLQHTGAAWYCLQLADCTTWCTEGMALHAFLKRELQMQQREEIDHFWQEP